MFQLKKKKQTPKFSGIGYTEDAAVSRQVMAVERDRRSKATRSFVIWALEFYESRSKLRFPELPPDFDEPSYYIGDLKDDISDDADAMDVDEAETAGPSVLNVRQPRIRSLDDNSIEGDTFSSKAKGKQRAMSREACERAETSPMETGSEDASSTQGEGGWIMEVSVDEDVIGVTEDQDVVTELLGFMDSDVGRSRWSIQNFAFDIEGETLRKKYGVAQGDRTSKADHVAFIEACEHLTYVKAKNKRWALLWCLPLRTQKERTRVRTQAREEALEKLDRINWDENADDPSKPIICMILHNSIQDWERVHEKVDMQRCQEFSDRFGQITAENLSLWRGGKSALDAPKKYPLYLITYPDDQDQLQKVQKEGITDDPFLRDKVRYIRKHWDEKNWKISRTLVDNREQALQRINKVDGGKWQATLPYDCTEGCKNLVYRYWTSLIEKLDLGNKITRNMIENMEYSKSGDQGEGDDDDNGDSGA
ncbi:hypothetical protein SLS60_003812 [Paraconiothyrium brasiliense]|uniref:Uncharacterized protein n=1 Tax=Paraconiothyrium brasiliense TaxID=300254 RepID=A0ABR3RPP7_9PLEO